MKFAILLFLMAAYAAQLSGQAKPPLVEVQALETQLQGNPAFSDIRLFYSFW